MGDPIDLIRSASVPASLPSQLPISSLIPADYRADKEACLFISGINLKFKSSIVALELDYIFGAFGQIIDIAISKDPSLIKPTCAWVQFFSVIDAEVALEQTKAGVNFMGELVNVCLARINTTIYLAKLDQEIIETLKHFGEIEEIRKTPLKAGEKFGSGFVKFRYRSDAFNALCAKNLGTTANWAKQLFKHSKNSNNSVFVGQLNPEKVTGENFSNLFSTIGPIRTFKLIKSDKTRPAYGFVTFKNEGDAQKAISTLNGSRFHESKILVEENVSKCAVGKESKAVGTKEL